MELVQLDSLIKNHGARFRLGPLDLSVSAGKVLGVMGPPGAGKTTLLRLIWGFLRPDRGDVFVFRQKPHLHQVDVRCRAGYLAESPHFYGWMNARQHLEFMSGFYASWDMSKAEALLDQFGIDPSLDIGHMSRGHLAKLGLVAASSHSPSLLLLDEPTAGLEPMVRQEILQFLKDLAANYGVGIVVSSHISEDLDNLADSVLMLNDGSVVEYAPAATIVHQYGINRMEDIFLEAVRKALPHRCDNYQEGLA